MGVTEFGYKPGVYGGRLGSVVPIPLEDTVIIIILQRAFIGRRKTRCKEFIYLFWGFWSLGTSLQRHTETGWANE